MVNRVIAGTIILAFLLVIVAISYICLSSFGAEKLPEQTALNISENKTAAKSITLMPDEEDDIPLTESTDLAAFAQDQMNKLGIFQEELAGAVPGKPVFIHSLDKNRHDYYLIPFEKDGYISVIAQVSIKDDVADFSSAYPPFFKTQDVVRPTLEEVKEVLSENGYEGNWSARLVWKPCEQTQSPTCPVWELSQDDEKNIFVGYYPFDKKIHIYDELTEKTVMG
ncbi:hypothetical protein [Methanofollis ethanolicus]|uniref:hypothetical protein n=1 Tax=Methanofollis ethanolicus TaxID=488124 RepID=UPI000836F49E|nr:hypothetical protein [Methanofollis ethanolicus]